MHMNHMLRSRKPQKRVPINPITPKQMAPAQKKIFAEGVEKSHIPASFALLITPFVSGVIGRVTSALNVCIKLWEN